MKERKDFRTLEENFLLLQEKGQSQDLSLGDILDILAGKGRPILLILLTLPFCLPIQIPGFSTPFGILIAWMGLRIILGKKIWIPKKLASRKIPSHIVEKITQKTLLFIKKVKPWIHPRLTSLCHFPLFKKVNGLLVLFLGFLLSLPLPIPFSNLVAAWPILFIGLGALEDDGVFILIGYFLSLVAVGFFLALGLTLKSFF